jgi:hypothetical protein
VRLVLTIVQMSRRKVANEEKTPLYVYMYFEMPYHIFNIVSYIVLMQWIQLWAVLADAATLAERRSEFDRLRETQNQLMTNSIGNGGGLGAKGIVNLTLAATIAQS